MPKKSHKTLMSIFESNDPTKMSNGQIRMMCPFRENHKDGSGRMSFFVSPDINAYHCFSCGAKGSLINLLTTKFKVNYFEAVEFVRLNDYDEHKEEKSFDLDLIWDYNKPPKEFLDREYSIDTLKYFRVGLSDSDEIVIPYYDSFKTLENLLGYQKRRYTDRGRIVCNSKGFNKKDYLYNLDYSQNYTILVEGQSDVWRLHQFGFNACALMGSSLSDDQILKLSKFERVYLALDNDYTGRYTTEICNEKLRNYTNILLVPYTTKDPGECLSRKQWVKAFNESTDYMDYTLNMALMWDGYLEMRSKVLKS